MTTTPEPLSGLVITMSSRFASFLIDFSSVFGGLGPFLSMQLIMTERRVAAAKSFLSSGGVGSNFQ